MKHISLPDRTTLFKSRKKQQKQIETERLAREYQNQTGSLFLRLPAEIRDQIYDEALPTNQEIKHSIRKPRKVRLSPLLHVCRQIRNEVYPVYFGRNFVTIVLQHLTLHPRTLLRAKSCVNLLPEPTGTDNWMLVKVESASRCFHADGFAVLMNMDIIINRHHGIIACHPRGQTYLRKEACCRAAQEKYSRWLLSEIRAMKFQDPGKRLRRQDFERLARRMDENRQDWPMAPKRVVPRRTWFEQ